MIAAPRLRHASRLRSRDRPSKRYEVLADEIEASIRAGTLRAGDRLPSVRQAAASRDVHASTVFQAYYRLEARGLIRAQARSGYYVAAVPPPEVEHVSAPEGESIAVDVGERVFAILRATMRRDVVPLGSAFPSPLLFPLARLARTMAATVQRLDPRASVDHLHQGNAALRRQIALRYLVDGLAVDADDLVVTNGAMEALHLALAAVTKPGDAVVVESPTFYAALQALEQRGLRAIEVATHPREGIELGALADVLERQRPAACWLMTNFQNPLGSLMPEAKKRELVELRDTGVPAFVEAHLLMAVACRLVRMHHRGDVAGAFGLVGHGDHGRERHPGRGRTPSAGEHRGEGDPRFGHHFEEAAGVVARAAIRPLHEGVEFAAGAHVEGADLRGPRPGAPPLLEQLRFGPRPPKGLAWRADDARDDEILITGGVCVFLGHVCSPGEVSLRRRPCDRCALPMSRAPRRANARHPSTMRARARRCAHGRPCPIG